MNVKLFIKRFVLVFFLVLLGLSLAGITTFVIIFKDEFKTLQSLQQVDNYGMYTMEYSGDYNLDGLLVDGIKNDSEIGRFVIDNLLTFDKCEGVKDLLTDAFERVDGGCTSFVTRNDEGEILYGRNYDYIYSPSLVLMTKPENGYASMSTVNLNVLGFTSSSLIPLKGRQRLSWYEGALMLLTPFLPFDGMNEKGVAISMLTVPEAQPPLDFAKPMLNPTLAIRLILDKAANVEEAVELLRKYNIYFSGNVPCHFLIGDASGESVIIEYLDKEMKVIKSDKPFQTCSNHIEFDDRVGGNGQDRCELISNKITENYNRISNDEALSLLSKTGGYDGANDSLQWSVLYNLTNLNSEIFAHRKVKDRTFFQLERDN